jgi:chemotaxis signal transduction protein
MAEFVVFRLEAINIGLRASTIEWVVHAVEVTPLPRAPDIALGVINVRCTHPHTGGNCRDFGDTI